MTDKQTAKDIVRAFGWKSVAQFAEYKGVTPDACYKLFTRDEQAFKDDVRFHVTKKINELL